MKKNVVFACILVVLIAVFILFDGNYIFRNVSKNSLQNENITFSISKHIDISFNGKEQDGLIATTILNRSPPSTNFVVNEKFKKYFLDDLNNLIDKNHGVYEFRLLWWYSSTDTANIIFLYDIKLSEEEINELTNKVLDTIEKRWYTSKVELAREIKLDPLNPQKISITSVGSNNVTINIVGNQAIESSKIFIFVNNVQRMCFWSNSNDLFLPSEIITCTFNGKPCVNNQIIRVKSPGNFDEITCLNSEEEITNINVKYQPQEEKKIAIVELNPNYVIVRNIGRVPLTTAEISVFIGSQQTDCNWLNVTTIQISTVAKCLLNDIACHTGETLKITAASSSDLDTC